ncbi:MAG: chemotaxis protein CheB [Bdellovibrionales bacterium]
MIDPSRVKVIVIGASMGGLNAFAKIFSQIHEDFYLPIVCVNHITANFDSNWIKDINSKTPLEVSWGEHYQFVKPGHCIFGPPDHHIVFSGKTRVLLNDDEPYHQCRPAINHLFHSAAEHYGRGVLAILLTGLNHDGTDGLISVLQKHGQVLIQDPDDAAVADMPMAAVHKINPEYVYTLDEIARLMNQVSNYQRKFSK